MNLSPDDARLFFRLFLPLLVYTNRQLNVVPNVSTVQEITEIGTAGVAKIRAALYAHPRLLDQFVAENPEGFTADELQLIASWKHRVSGDFYLMRYLKKYVVFMPAKKADHLYGVMGLFDPIEHVVPGFTQYNQRVRQPGGFYLPNGPREGTFTTESKRARFTVHPFPRHRLGAGQLLLTTLRSHDQFNTTIYGEDDRYRGIYGGRRVVFLNEADIVERGLEENAWVDLISHFGPERRRAERFKVVKYAIPKGCAAAYYPETNVLVPVRSVADVSNQPASKSIVITVERVAPQATARS